MSYANQPIPEKYWEIVAGSTPDEHGNIVISLIWRGGNEDPDKNLPKLLSWIWDRVFLYVNKRHWPIWQITLSGVHASGEAKKSVDVEELFVPYFVKMIEEMTRTRNDGSILGWEQQFYGQYITRMPKLRALLKKYQDAIDRANKATKEIHDKVMEEFKRKYPCYREGMTELEFLPCAFRVGFGETFTFLGELLGETLNLPKAALETVLPGYLPYIAAGVLVLLLLK